MTFEADTPLVTRVVESLGYRRDQYEERREYGAVTSHVCGAGILRRYDEGWRPSWAGLDESSTLLDVAAAVYASIMDASGHYLVYETDVVQLVPEGLAAWHVGSRDAEQYRRRDWMAPAYYGGEKVDVMWWLDRHTGIRSPLELAGGRLWGEELSANRGSAGIEIVWPHDEARTPPSDTTMATWAALVRDICERREIPLDLYHAALTHSDAHPAARSAGGEAWDPPPSVLTPARAAELLGIPLWCPPA